MQPALHALFDELEKIGMAAVRFSKHWVPGEPLPHVLYRLMDRTGMSKRDATQMLRQIRGAVQDASGPKYVLPDKESFLPLHARAPTGDVEYLGKFPISKSKEQVDEHVVPTFLGKRMRGRPDGTGEEIEDFANLLTVKGNRAFQPRIEEIERKIFDRMRSTGRGAAPSGARPFDPPTFKP